jgi:diguanylate cyclase (GGDEF)-like protein
MHCMSDFCVEVLHVVPCDGRDWSPRLAARTDTAYGPFNATVCGVDDLWQRLAAVPADVIVVHADWDGWMRCAAEIAVVVVDHLQTGAPLHATAQPTAQPAAQPTAHPAPDAPATTKPAAKTNAKAATTVASRTARKTNVHAGERDAAQRGVRWLQAGAQDVLTAEEFAGAHMPRRLRAAYIRQQVRMATRQAFATDVHTGLPHQGQLIEHMSHLLALREREPAPMALLVLRIEGLSTTALRLGGEAAGALRRKVAVRLRAGVRASDVVASIADDSFAVLLSQLDAPADAQRVGGKLMTALVEPFHVAGVEAAVATALGIAAYPADGTQPELLLRRAAGLAASASASGRAGYANRIERGDVGAANDDGPG